MSRADAPTAPLAGTPGEVFAAFFALGLTSFGGPIAHLGYFRDELVARRGWVDEHGYAQLVALGQLLPGPASSQVGFSLGVVRAGWLGGLAAFVGFTLPSALLMLAFFAGLLALQGPALSGALHGLELVAVAVVAQAVWGMRGALLTTPSRLGVAALALVLLALVPGIAGQLLVMSLGALCGLLLGWGNASGTNASVPAGASSMRVGIALLAAFALLLLGLPLLAAAGVGGFAVQFLDAFYRTGALVFGGGHVVMPLLEDSVVAPGWVSPPTFLAGYAAAQAVPGPLFTFATFLGAAAAPSGYTLLGALGATLAIFAPGLLLMGAALPLWRRLAAVPAIAHLIAGANVAVVALLAAALFDPVATLALRTPLDYALAVTIYLLLAAGRVPPWILVGATALGGCLLALM
ncbi:chromate efflux transporter [Devosia sp. 1566]|uniref:chromate efflux transporter n=1 Tax=Devosia sp. 1566 TaxID=2499144 RepID=UPI000FD9DD41|nr:chromate efflux transporter [Devosia sp. 1566]